MEVTAEEVCDDFVVHWGADRARYAGQLLDLAERTLPPLAPSGVGMISLRSLLARRVRGSSIHRERSRPGRGGGPSRRRCWRVWLERSSRA